MTAVVSIATTLLAASLPAPATAGRPDQPTWSDEFAGTELDSTKWGPRATGQRRDGYLTSQAVAVGEGALTITTYTEDDKHYSGMISTLAGTEPFEQTFGYFEARVRFNSSPGQWSAFWLHSPTFGTPVGDPATAGVEMDVVEHRVRCVDAPAPTPAQTCGSTSSIADRAQTALIWDGYQAPASQSAVKLSEPLPGLGNGSWHTWALNWTPTKLTFLFDDREIWSRTEPISQRSQHVILSSEVGRLFAGEIPAAGYGTRATSTTNMQVDYVRAWRTPAAPAESTSAPVASGTADVGGVLACSNGTWSASAAPTFEYEWLSDGSTIAGAAATVYTVQPADRGRALSCRVTASNIGGSASAQSNAIPIPAAPPLVALSSPPLPAPPPAPPPPAPLDRSAPRATISGARAQRLGPVVSVRVSCRDEPCRATATSTLRVPRVGRARARTYKPRAAVAIAAGRTTTIKLRLAKGARDTIRRALRARKRISVRVSVRVTDGAGNATTLVRRVALRLPPRR